MAVLARSQRVSQRRISVRTTRAHGTNTADAHGLLAWSRHRDDREREHSVTEKLGTGVRGSGLRTRKDSSSDRGPPLSIRTKRQRRDRQLLHPRQAQWLSNAKPRPLTSAQNRKLGPSHPPSDWFRGLRRNLGITAQGNWGSLREQELERQPRSSQRRGFT